MREILFRGKRKDNGEWVKGSLWDEIPGELVGIAQYGSCVFRHVDLETVGQFTGLTDKNGQKIFDGDIIEWFAQGESEHPDFGYIKYDEQSFAWCVCWHKYDPDFMEGMQQEYISVVGNIHDNPELL